MLSSRLSNISFPSVAWNRRARWRSILLLLSVPTPKPVVHQVQPCIMGFSNNSRSRRITAAGMENGELGLWDPEKLLEMSEYVFHKLMLGWRWRISCLSFSAAASLILRNTTHQGSVRGIDFNPIQTNLLSSGAVNSEVSTAMCVSEYSTFSDFYSSTSGISKTLQTSNPQVHVCQN